MGARPVGMAFLVGLDRELRNMAIHRAAREIEADMAAARTAFLGADQGQVDRVGDEIGFQQQAFWTPRLAK